MFAYLSAKRMKFVLCLLVAIAFAFSGCSKSSSASGNHSIGQGKVTIALMPKSKGNAYFISCKNGAERAAKDLGVDLIFDGPTDPDPAKQNEIIENWITLGVDAIAAACENREGISTALRKARAKGVKVITYDSDAAPDARDFFVNQATPEGIANALMDEAARLCANEGEFAIITASLTAANMNEWQKYIELRRSSKYPGLKMDALRPCDDLKDRAQTEATALLGAYPNLKLIMAICSPAVPGAAEAVKQAGKAGKVKVIGLGLPSENRNYVKEGVTDTVILWKTEDLGYLTVCAARALAKGELKPADTSFQAGPLGRFEIQGDNILLGKPFLFKKDNIDQFNF
jgi:ABC-type sugar transport system substrate-binding protein